MFWVGLFVLALVVKVVVAWTSVSDVLKLDRRDTAVTLGCLLCGLGAFSIFATLVSDFGSVSGPAFLGDLRLETIANGTSQVHACTITVTTRRTRDRPELPLIVLLGTAVAMTLLVMWYLGRFRIRVMLALIILVYFIAFLMALPSRSTEYMRVQLGPCEEELRPCWPLDPRALASVVNDELLALWREREGATELSVDSILGATSVLDDGALELVSVDRRPEDDRHSELAKFVRELLLPALAARMLAQFELRTGPSKSQRLTYHIGLWYSLLVLRPEAAGVDTPLGRHLLSRATPATQTQFFAALTLADPRLPPTPR